MFGHGRLRKAHSINYGSSDTARRCQKQAQDADAGRMGQSLGKDGNGFVVRHHAPARTGDIVRLSSIYNLTE